MDSLDSVGPAPVYPPSASLLYSEPSSRRLPARQNSDDPSTSSGYSTNTAHNSPATVLTDDTIYSLQENPYKSTTRGRYGGGKAKVTFVEPVPEEEALVELPRNEDHPSKPPLPSTTAPDGGYGWVIVLASFSIQMIGIGLAMSFGVMYVELQEQYNAEAGVVAWVGAICIGLSLGAGPAASVLANALGHRLSSMIGGLVASVGLFVSAFSPGIYFLYISYGVVTGIGISLSYVPAVVMVGFYFELRRPVASGVAVAGVGFGGLIYPPLIQILIETYTWRGTMIILSGISLNTLVFSALLRPLPKRLDDKSKVKICDIELLKDPVFLIFSIAEVLWNIGSLVLMTIAPHHSMLQGVGKEKAALLLSVVGITGTLGRMIFVVIPLHWDKLTMMTAATYVSALPMVLYPLSPEFGFHIVHCIVYGLSFGVQLAVLPVVTVDLFGLKRLTSAYGYLVLADGIGALIGPFLGGHLFDVTGDYTLSFIVGAVVSVLSGAFMTAILAERLCNRPLPRRLSLSLLGRDKTDEVDIPEPASEVFL